MFFEPNRTQFDLNWRMLGTDVRVHPMFWLISAALGWDFVQSGFWYLVLWVVCVFVSVLLHEFGHILVGRIFGSRGHIVLYGFGGLAIGSSNLANRWQRIAVSFAGPFVQLVLYLGLWGFEWWLVKYGHAWVRPGAPADVLLLGLVMLKWINLYWPILNLLPIWPLDGGRISRDFLDWLLPERGINASLGISFATAGFLAICALMEANDRPLLPVYLGGVYMAVFFGLFALTNYQELQQLRQAHRRWDYDRDPWDTSDRPWKG